MLYCFCCTRIG